MTMREMADAVANNIADAVSQCLWHGDNDYGFDTDEAAILIAPILTTVFQRIADEATAKERERAAMVAEKQYADDGDDMVALAAGLNIAAAIRQPPQPTVIVAGGDRGTREYKTYADYVADKSSKPKE